MVLVKALRLSRSGEMHGSSVYSHFIIALPGHPCLYSSDFTFAAEVVEVVGSPCLKKFLVAHLSNVAHGIPDKPWAKEDIIAQNSTNGTESNEGMVVSIPINRVSVPDDLCVLVAGKHKVPSCLPTAGVAMVQHESQHDSQDSILDIERIIDDDDDDDVEITLMEWNTDGLGRLGNLLNIISMRPLVLFSVDSIDKKFEIFSFVVRHLETIRYFL